MLKQQRVVVGAYDLVCLLHAAESLLGVHEATSPPDSEVKLVIKPELYNDLKNSVKCCKLVLEINGIKYEHNIPSGG